jgi:hypothetical protein
MPATAVSVAFGRCASTTLSTGAASAIDAANPAVHVRSFALVILMILLL